MNQKNCSVLETSVHSSIQLQWYATRLRRDCDNVDDLLTKLTAEMWNATRTSCDFDSFVSIKLIGSVNSIVMRSNDAMYGDT